MMIQTNPDKHLSPLDALQPTDKPSTDQQVKHHQPEALKADFASSVYDSYLRMGSKLRNTIRHQNRIKNAQAIFKQVGPLREDLVLSLTPSSSHSYVDELVAKQDVTDTPEMAETSQDAAAVQKAIRGAAYALGRCSDGLILEALECDLPDTRIVMGTGAGLGDQYGLTKAKILHGLTMLDDCPSDGERVGIVGWRQWVDLLNIPEFAAADYVADDMLPWKGTGAKRWLGTLWMPHSGLTKDADGLRHCYWYHRSAIGHAVGECLSADFTWDAGRAAFLVDCKLDQGATILDPRGVITIRAFEV